MNTTENNKIIAEFLEYAKQTWPYNDAVGYFTPYSDRSLFSSDLKFHSDWNWLMEVVIKINATTDYTLVIQSMDCYVYNVNSGKHITHPSGNWQPDELIKSVYEVVVEFITWFNLQNS